MDQLTQILTEIRDLREDHNEFARETVERLSALETALKPLLPNGRPGKIAEIEASVRKLENGKYWLMGFSAAIGSAIPTLAHMLHLI